MTGRKTMRNFVGQWYHVKQWQKFCTETLETVSLNAKKWLQETSSGTFLHEFFHVIFVLLISNHTVFLVQFGINLQLSVFQKAEIALAEAAPAIWTFWKTLARKLIPIWTRNRLITYMNCMTRGPILPINWVHNKLILKLKHFVSFLSKSQ